MAIVTLLEPADMTIFSPLGTHGRLDGSNVMSVGTRLTNPPSVPFERQEAFVYGNFVVSTGPITGTAHTALFNYANFAPQVLITGLSFTMTAAKNYGDFGVAVLLADMLAGNDALTGSSGNDVILGFGGNDTFLFSGGTDTYDGGGAIDTVSYAGATAGLFAGIEDFAFNTGAAQGDTYIEIENLIGTAFNDILYGNGLVNRLSGGNGNDRLVGKGGGDTFDGGAGSDTVSYDAEPFGLRADLLLPATNTGDAFGDVYIGIENLDGSSFNDSLFGNGAVNVLRGSSYPASASGNDTLDGRGGNDHLFGYDGNDRLIGGPGNDRLFGGLGADRFVFSAALNAATNVDTVGDFTVNVDEFELENAIFTTLGAAGALNPNLFWKSATGLAHDADDRIVYNTVTGVLTYDTNGNAAGGTTTIAVLSNKAAITAADFTVI